MKALSELLGNEDVAIVLLLVGVFLLVFVFIAIYNYTKDKKQTRVIPGGCADDNQELCDDIQKDNSEKHNQFLVINNRFRSQKWRFDMTGNIVIGRSTARCDIAFEQDKTLASRHAVISFVNDTAYICPVSSNLEVYVQDKLITDRVELGAQQVVALGNQMLRVIYE